MEQRVRGGAARQYCRSKAADRQDDAVIGLLKEKLTLQVDWGTGLNHLEALLITRTNTTANKKSGTRLDASEYLQVRCNGSQYKYLLGSCRGGSDAHWRRTPFAEPVQSALDEL